MRYFFLPEQLAVWNLTVVIVNAASLFQVNLIAAINIKIAQMIGSGEADVEKQKVRASAVCIEFFQQLVLIAGVLLLAPLIWDLPEKFSTIVLLSAGLTVFQTALINLFVGLHESNGSFVRLGIVLPINAFMQLLLVWVGILTFELMGLFVSMLLGSLLSLIILLFSLKFLRLGAVQSPSLVQSKKLLDTAFRFRVYDIGTSVFYALDTLVASVVLTPIGLSLFVTAKFCASLSSQAILAFSRMNLVRLGNSIGAGRDSIEISEDITKQFFLVYVVLAPALILLSAPLFRLVLPVYLPAYTDSLNVLPFFMLGILCSSRGLFLRNLWIQSNQWRSIGASGIMALATSVPILYFGIHFFGPLDGADLAKLVVVSQMPYALVLIFIVSKTNCSLNHALNRLFFFFFSFVGICVSLHFNGSYAAFSYNNFSSFVYSLSIGFASFIPFLICGFIVNKLISNKTPAS